MTIDQINAAIENGKEIKICPWNDAFSNQCLVRVLWVTGNRTVKYTWQSLDDEPVTKVSQVSYSTWRSIVEQAA